MSRISWILFVLAIAALTLTGCRREAETAENTAGFSQSDTESAWRKAHTESIRSEEAKRPHIELVFSVANQRQENQIRAIRGFISRGVDVIALSPIVETGWEPVLREARAAGIPVVLTDTAVDVEEDDLYVAFIGADFEEEGRQAARWLTEATGGEAVIVELTGNPGSATTIDRGTGFREILEGYPDMEIIKSQSGNFERAGGREAMAAFLQLPESSQITALFAHNDDMALGAIQAIEEAGLEPGADILIVSIGGARGAFEAMIAGKLNCTVEHSPLIGPPLFDLIEKIMAGEEVPRRVVVPGGVYTRDMAADLIDTRAY